MSIGFSPNAAQVVGVNVLSEPDRAGSDPDRLSVLDHLFTGGVLSNRDLVKDRNGAAGSHGQGLHSRIVANRYLLPNDQLFKGGGHGVVGVQQNCGGKGLSYVVFAHAEKDYAKSGLHVKPPW
jgi:hypothetical protein